jgi:hypothetical protein
MAKQVAQTSIHGRKLGLQILSTVITGGSQGEKTALVGAPYRSDISTGESTGTGIPAHGMTILVGTSVASTPVFQLDPPIPGMIKTIYFGSTDSHLIIKTKGGEAIAGTSLGNTGAGFATAVHSSGGGVFKLVGLTTGVWGALAASSSAVNTMRYAATS